LSRSSDREQIGVGVDAQVGPLGEVLAQQPVGVLVRATLPRAGRVREVHTLGDVASDAVVPGHRETTPAILARVTATLDDRISRTEQIAVELLRGAGEPRKARTG
jgi:hypothetical protein